VFVLPVIRVAGRSPALVLLVTTLDVAATGRRLL
jgi:hypothetical protein